MTINYLARINFSSDNTIPISVFLKHTVDSHTGSFKVDVTRHKLIGSFNIGLIDVYYDKYAIFQSCDIAEEIGKLIRFHLFLYDFILMTFDLNFVFRIHLDINEKSYCYG